MIVVIASFGSSVAIAIIVIAEARSIE